jgi:hypothetical protein
MPQVVLSNIFKVARWYGNKKEPVPRPLLQRESTLKSYERCFDTSLVISNIETWSFLKMGLSLSSALMLRLFLLSWSLFFLMYAQSFFVTSVLGIGVAPTIAANFSLGVTGAMNFDVAAFFAMIDPPVYVSDYTGK